MSCGCGDCGCESIQLTTINGVDGQDGAAGTDGITPSVTVGSVTALPSGSTPTVTDVGTAPDVILDFGLPVPDDGADGADGVNSFSTLTANFTMPALDGVDTISMVDASWVVQGQWLYIYGIGFLRAVTGPIGNDVTVRNPGASEGFPTGVTGNASPGGITLTGSKIGPAGRPGTNGADGSTGSTGGTGPAGTVVVGTGPPAGAPPDGEETYIDDATNDLYYYSGGSWTLMTNLTGARGSQMYSVSADPNTSPPAGAQDGDFAFRDDLAGILRVYQRGGGAWAVVVSIDGASASSFTDVFRATKLSAQPIPTGATDPTVVQFEDWTGPGLYNYGGWNGSNYIATADAATTQTFIIENVTIDTSVAEVINFDVDIMLNGVSQANDTITISSGTSGSLAVLTTGPITIAPGDEVRVEVTPSANPTQQWYVAVGSIVFYDQTS